MADEVLIAQFRADVEGVKAQLDTYVKGLEQVQKEEKDTQKTTQETAKTSEEALKKRNNLVKQELVELKKLQDARKRAFTPESIDQFNRKIGESKTRLASLRGEANGLSTSIKSSLAGIGAGFAAAFSIQAVTAFAKQAVESFLEAEVSANRLKFAITQIGGETEVVFNRLIEQSSKLQEISIFSDESIQSAQTALATFGLTGDQIEQLTPKILDFASATKTDLTSATDTFLRALEGQARGLTTAGLKFKDTGTIIGNYNVLMQATEKFTGATAEATKTLTGELQQEENQVDELQEKVGEGLAPAWVAVKKATFEATLEVIRFFEAGGNLAVSLFQHQVEKGGTAVEEVTKKIKEQTKALVDVGFTEEKAREEAIKNIRAEINERLTLAIDKAKAAQADKNLSDLEKQRIANRLTAIRNELNVIVQLDEVRQRALADEARRLKAEELRLKSISQLNSLLEANQEINDAIGKDNVTLINREIEARKKLAEEQKKAADIREPNQNEEIRKLALLGESYESILESLRGISKFELLELSVLAKIDPQKFKEEVAKLVVSEVDSIQIPVELEAKPPGPEFLDGIKKTTSEMLHEWFEANAQILQDSEQLVGSLLNLYGQLGEKRINQIEETKTAELEAIDARFEAIESDFDKRRITEKDFERSKQALEAQRVAAEKKAADETRRIKRRQFEIERIASLARIAIETAEKAVETYPVSAIVIAFGALEAGIVSAQPNPYKKGTKRSKAGLALVGEEGPELMVLPEGAKIAPHGQTKKYAKVIDSMIDDSFDNKYSLNDITPHLAKQKKMRDEDDKRMMAESITKSMVINQISNAKSDYLLDKIAKIIARNPAEIAGIIESHRTSPYR